MKLADYLVRSGMTPSDLRRKLGVASRSVMSRYLTGERTPNLHMLQKIIELTGGQVQLRDFLSPGNPECATIVELPDGRKRLVFPWTNWDPLDAANDSDADDDPTADRADALSAPIRMAIKVLGARVTTGPKGQFFLDGRPSHARGVVTAANRMLKTWRRELIPYPGVESEEGVR